MKRKVKKLTQLQAWQLLHRLFRKVSGGDCGDCQRGDGLSKREDNVFNLNMANLGLCGNIQDLCRAGHISERVESAMALKISNELDRLPDDPAWLATWDSAGAKVRREFCKKQIKNLRRKK